MKWEEARGEDIRQQMKTEEKRDKSRQECMRSENWEKMRRDNIRWKQMWSGRKEHKKRCDEINK